MPMSYETQTLSSGLRAVVITSVGTIGEADALDYARRMGPDSPDHALPVLFLSTTALDITAEARGILTSKAVADRPAAMAVVTQSAPLRVLVNLLLRISGQPHKVKIMRTQEEAETWLLGQGA